VLVSEGAIFLESFSHDPDELRRYLRVPLTGQFRVLVKDGSIGRSLRVSIEG
jgi:hypothetical protein